MTLELGDVFVEREFEAADEDGNIEKIILRLGKPYFNSTSTHASKWRCPYQIIGIGNDEKIRDFAGEDGLDAVFNALRIAEHYIKSYGRMENVKISWLGREDLDLYRVSLFEIQHKDDPVSEETTKIFQDAFDEFFRNFKPKTPPDKPTDSQ